MKTMALLINPIAGMGGQAGLKGTDGADILQRALDLGAQPEAEVKAGKALQHLAEVDAPVKLLVAAGAMGENAAKAAGLDYEVIYEPSGKEALETQKSDTEAFLDAAKAAQPDLLVFVGGDGTARDVCRKIGLDIPALGVPAGVKIYSAVYANSPESAGRLLAEWAQDSPMDYHETEVLDLDEAGFRQDEVDIQVFGYLRVPQHSQFMQNLKSASPQSDEAAQESIALDVLDHMDDEAMYLIGSGTSTRHIMDELGLDVTVLGVDIIKNRQLLVKDANEQEILDAIEGEEDVRLIVTPMGGQGYILGRGNQQLSKRVLAHIDKDKLSIVATPSKIMTIGTNPFLIYTMDDAIDEKFTGYYKVTTGYGQYSMHKVEAMK